jgi:hypothetical protein
MKGGIFGFSRKEVLWFTTFFIISVSLITFSVVKLISKYYNYSSNSAAQIKKGSHDLSNIQDLDHYAVNIQRGSLNLIIYSKNPKELENVQTTILKNRDSLSTKLAQLETDSLLDSSLRDQVNNAGQNYLIVNQKFLKIISDSARKDLPENFNVNTMRPTLRKFTDLIRLTGKSLSLQIQQTTEKGLNIFHQYEFWMLAIMLMPYVYFFFRFLYLVIKMIVWDFTS